MHPSVEDRLGEAVLSWAVPGHVILAENAREGLDGIAAVLGCFLRVEERPLRLEG